MPLKRTARLFPPTLLLFLMSAPGPQAHTEAHVGALELSRTTNSYRMEALVELAARASVVRRILDEPSLLPELNPRVESVEVLGRAIDGGPRVRLQLRRCFLLFCRSYRRAQSMRPDAAGDLHVRLREGGGAVRGGSIEYRIEAGPGPRSRVRVSALIVPATDLPPLVGPALMQDALTEDVHGWARGIARLARSASGSRLRVAIAPTLAN